MTIEELVESFDMLGDWEERYRFLIDLGNALPPMPPEDKTPQTAVSGCASQVWMTASFGADGTFDFTADSDSSIVRGLIAVLRIIYAGRRREEVVKTDAAEIFARLGLGQHLSPNRRNGFFSMVNRIKALSARPG